MNFISKAARKTVHSLLHLFNIDLVFSSTPRQEKHRARLLDLLDIDLLVDVGANIGQYSLGLLKNGFKGNIISFEPVSDVHDKLVAQSKSYDKWLVYNRCAIGEKEGEAEINVSQNYESSSMYKVLETSITAEPMTIFVRKEKVKIERLSDVAELKKFERLHLKIDVQGYEEKVLKGAEDIFDRVASIEVEISLVPLYQGALSAEMLLRKLKEHGFEPVFFTSAFNDIHTGAIMQLDGLFVKRELLKLVANK